MLVDTAALRAPVNIIRSTTTRRRWTAAKSAVRNLRRRFGGIGDSHRRFRNRSDVSGCKSRGRTSSALPVGFPTESRFTTCAFRSSSPATPRPIKKRVRSNYLHVLGRDPDRDVPIFGYGVNPSVPFDKTDFPIVVYSPVSRHMLGLVVHGVKNEQTIYSTASLSAPPSQQHDRMDEDRIGRRRRRLHGSQRFDDLHDDAPRRSDVQGARDVARRSECGERQSDRAGGQVDRAADFRRRRRAVRAFAHRWFREDRPAGVGTTTARRERAAAFVCRSPARSTLWQPIRRRPERCSV